MASKVRVVERDGATSLVDEGGRVAEELKQAKKADVECKKKITAMAEEMFEDGESSLALMGDEFVVTVTRSRKRVLDIHAEGFDDVASNPILSDLLRARHTLMVPPEDVERAGRVLKRAGFDVAIETTYELDTSAFEAETKRDLTSPAREDAIKALDACVKTSETTRVAYKGV